MKTVSVVVPTRNRRALLEMTLRSVLCQQEVDLEVIVVDEASTDSTPALLGTVTDPRVHVIRNDAPRGVSSARNQAAAVARGEWLAFIDDDDLWAPDKLVRQLQAARDTGCHWVYTGSVNITDRGAIVGGEAPPAPEVIVAALRRYNAIPGGGSNVIVHGLTLKHAGVFDLRLRNTEDWEMWIRLAKEGPPAWVCRPLVAYRVHGSNASLDTAEIVRGARLIEVLHDTTVDWGRLYRFLAESSLRMGHRRAAAGWFARAALGGQLRGVASDVASILRRHHRRGATGEKALSAEAWIGQATAWLRAFEAGGCSQPRLAPPDVLLRER